MPRSVTAGFVLAVTGLILIAGLVAACGNAGDSAPASSPASPAASAVVGGAAASAGSPGASGARASGEPEVAVWLPEWAGDIPTKVVGRRPLPFCGVERAPAPQPGIFVDRAIRLCFWNAHLSGDEAEFVSLQSTMEGAPIATIYRLAADGTVQVLTDFTQDQLGAGTWMLSNCARVVQRADKELLGVDECDDGLPLD